MRDRAIRMMPSGCLLSMFINEDPKGFPMEIFDHQDCGDFLPFTLLNTESLLLEMTDKLYTGTEISELIIPRPADTTYNGQLSVWEEASASRKLLPQYISRAGFITSAFLNLTNHCCATESIDPERSAFWCRSG